MNNNFVMTLRGGVVEVSGWSKSGIVLEFDLVPIDKLQIQQSPSFTQIKHK